MTCCSAVIWGHLYTAQIVSHVLTCFNRFQVDDVTVGLMVQQFLDEWHFRVLHSGLAYAWDRPEATKRHQHVLFPCLESQYQDAQAWCVDRELNICIAILFWVLIWVMVWYVTMFVSVISKKTWTHDACKCEALIKAMDIFEAAGMRINLEEKECPSRNRNTHHSSTTSCHLCLSRRNCVLLAFKKPVALRQLANLEEDWMIEGLVQRMPGAMILGWHLDILKLRK